MSYSELYTYAHYKELFSAWLPLIYILNIKLWPVKVTTAPDDQPGIIVHCQGKEERYTPVQISAMFLEGMVKNTLENLGKAKAIIAFPEHFNKSQCDATIEAGVLANLNVIDIIKEPTATALAYGLDKVQESNRLKMVLVFDLGNSLDVTLLHISMEYCKVKASIHIPSLDFNHEVI